MMDKKFEIGEYFEVGDGTLVSPFLNARDAKSPLPFDLLDGFSLAAGEIVPGETSKRHVHPQVTQVAFVWRRRLEIRMMGPYDDLPGSREFSAGEAAIIEPGTYLQLVSLSNESCHVLYIVSPAHVFDRDYDDLIVLDFDWDRPDRMNRLVRKRVEAGT